MADDWWAAKLCSKQVCLYLLITSSYNIFFRHAKYLVIRNFELIKHFNSFYFDF